MSDELLEEFRKEVNRAPYARGSFAGHNRGWCRRCGKFHRSTKGYKHTQETKDKMMVAVNNLWFDPGYRVKHSAGRKRYCNSPEGKKQMSEMAKIPHSLEHNANIGKGGRRFYASPEGKKQRHRQSDLRKQYCATPKGREQTLKSIKLANAASHTAEASAKRRKTHLELAATPEGKEYLRWFAELGNKAANTPEVNAKRGRTMSRILTGLWKDPKFVAKVEKGLHKRPTKDEEKLIDFFARYCPSFRYNGNFELKVNPDGLIPDFVDIRNRRIVEYFGDFRHTEEEAEKKTARYAREGWNCLILWPDDLKDKWALIAKLTKFITSCN